VGINGGQRVVQQVHVRCGIHGARERDAVPLAACVRTPRARAPNGAVRRARVCDTTTCFG
jgi:hypothetical protein